MSYAEKLKAAWAANPPALKIKAYKLGAKLFLALALLGSAYFMGRIDAGNSYEVALAKQREATNKILVANAVDAAQRFGEYTRTDAELTSAVKDAEEAVRDYYQQNPVIRKVPVNKLVPVLGEPNYVYVPDGVCPNDFFGPDELRLWNLGNARDFADPVR